MKKFVQVVLLLAFFLTVLFYKNDIITFIVKSFLFDKEVVIQKKNKYALNYEYSFVKETDDFFAKSKQQLYNVIFTGINNGNSQFSFFCDYDECTNDVNLLTTSDVLLDINNFIHPYNSYYKLFISMTSYGRVNISISKNYDDYTIEKVNNQIDKIEKEILNNNMTTTEKIKVFHDYIINITTYDNDYLLKKLNDPNHPSHKAVGPLFYKTALCGGYTDIMGIFLNRLNIPNYRIASEQHIWNFLYINNTWSHLDLTWDDPVTSDNQNVILHKFFLISDEELSKFNTGYHNFNKLIYLPN